MPTTLTLKNIPDDLYQRLKSVAEAHRRSLNSEAIACLETVLLPGRMPVQEQLTRARSLRQRVDAKFSAADIAAAIKQGRP